MKVRDITQLLQQAIIADSAWSPSRTTVALERLSGSFVAAQVDWDRDANETWARVLVEDSSVVVLSALVPVAFVRTPVESEVLAILKRCGVVIIAASDLDQREFRVDAETVKQAFGIREWSVAVDPEGFSAAELWWMTV